jgi:hypothetical protein
MSLLLLSLTAGLFLHPLRALRKEVLMLRRIDQKRRIQNGLLYIEAQLREGTLNHEIVMKEESLSTEFGRVQFKKENEGLTDDGIPIFLIRASVQISPKITIRRFFILP